MKQNKTNPGPNPTTGHVNPKAQGNKDKLDSRKNEEQDFNGDNITHNVKPTKADHKDQSKNKE